MRSYLFLLLVILSIWMMAQSSDFSDVHVSQSARLTLEQQEAVVARW